MCSASQFSSNTACSIWKNAVEIQNAYHNKIKQLLDSFRSSDSNKSESYKLTLSIQAHTLWREFQTSIEKELQPDGRFSVCQGWAGKTFGFVLRIAGLLHIAENGISHFVISENIMKNAIELLALLTSHAIAAFNFMGIDQVTEDAKTILQWITSNRVTRFSQSELVLAMRNKKLGKSERLQGEHVLLSFLACQPFPLVFTNTN
jgi:hypothetical protein